MKPHTDAARRITQAAICLALALGTATLAAVWRAWPAWFAEALAVPYPFQTFLTNYQRALADFPSLLAVVAAALLVLAAALWWSARREDGVAAPLALPRWGEALLVAALLGVAWWLSYRHWVYWGKPHWDDYWFFGRIFHEVWAQPGGKMIFQLQRFLHEYPHSPSPLTPLVIGFLMFLHDNPLRWLQVLSLSATVGSLLVLRTLSRRLTPTLPVWLLGALFLTNAATMRNSFFIQLDAISSFFVVAFYGVWLWWRDEPSQNRLTVLTVFLLAAVFQKTTLFPLLAIPTLVAVYDAWRARRVPWLDLLQTAAATALLPAAVFGAYLLALGVGGNFGTQLELMGTGWNELDFSVTRFVFATTFLLVPYLPLVLANRRWPEPETIALALFPLLFFASIVAVRGPFWSRYYSHAVGPWLLLAAPALARLAQSRAARPALVAYVGGVAAVQIAMLWLHVF